MASVAGCSSSIFLVKMEKEKGKRRVLHLFVDKKFKKGEKNLFLLLTKPFSCAILFRRPRENRLGMPKCRCGGIGRRPGLKIPWENIPYRFDPGHRHQFHIAEWSNPVARRAHNPKVVGSNPASATKKNKHPLGCLFLFAYGSLGTYRLRREPDRRLCGKSGE